MNNRARIQFIAFFLSFFFLFLIGRLAYLSLFRERYTVVVKQIASAPVSPLFRGDIYTSDKDNLATSLPFYSIFVDPSLMNHSMEQNYTNIFSAFGMSSSQIQILSQSQKKFHWISRMLPKETFFDLQKYLNLSLPGIVVKQEYKRVYPHDNLASSVVGFTNIDGVGMAGIEYSMNNYLEPNISSKKQHQILGYDVVLTINSKLQQKVESTIAESGKELLPKSISAIIMEADTGRILSMANYPSFDPNYYNSYKDPKIFTNMSLSHIDEPGSTFKPLIMAHLFDKHLISTQSRFSSNGQEKIHGFTIHEALQKRLGILSPEDILVHSSNIGMAKASLSLNKDELYDVLTSLHLGKATGVILPGEENGIVRPPKKMTERSRLVIPIGQEIGLTPIQLVSAFSTIANHGKQVFPRIVDHLEYEGKTLPFAEQKEDSPENSVYTPESADLMMKYMRQVVLKGSARKANIPGEWIAAKTGTAQIFDNQKGSYAELNTSIIAIYHNATTNKNYVIYGVIRAPKVDPNVAWGGTLAAPMVRNFILDLRTLIQNKSLTETH